MINGFIIEGGSTRIYHAGDTACFAGFSEIDRRFPAVDAAPLPIGAYEPAWFMYAANRGPIRGLRV